MGGIEIEMLTNFSRKIGKNKVTRKAYRNGRWYFALEEGTLAHSSTQSIELSGSMQGWVNKSSAISTQRKCKNSHSYTRVNTRFISGSTGDKRHLIVGKNVWRENELKSEIQKKFYSKSQHCFIIQTFTNICSKILNSSLSIVKGVVICMIPQIKKKLQVRSVQI